MGEIGAWIALFSYAETTSSEIFLQHADNCKYFPA